MLRFEPQEKTMAEIEAALKEIQMRRFKCWHNPEYLAYWDEQRLPALRNKFRIYFELRDYHERYSAETRADSSINCTAYLSTVSWIFDRARHDPSDAHLVLLLHKFEHHTSIRCQLTPLWDVMNIVTRGLLLHYDPEVAIPFA